MADQQQPSSSSTSSQNKVIWIDRQTLKNKKHEASPVIRMNDDAVTRYSAEIGKIKNLDNIAWKKLALNDARFLQLKKSIEENKQMLITMGQVLDPLVHSIQDQSQQQTENNNEEMNIEVPDPQTQSPVVENPGPISNDFEMQNGSTMGNQHLNNQPLGSSLMLN